MGSLELPEEGSHSHSICSHVMAATCGWVLRRLTQGTKAEDSGTNRRGWSSRKVMLTPFRLYHTKTSGMAGHSEQQPDTCHFYGGPCSVFFHKERALLAKNGCLLGTLAQAP